MIRTVHDEAAYTDSDEGAYTDSDEGAFTDSDEECRKNACVKATLRSYVYRMVQF